MLLLISWKAVFYNLPSPPSFLITLLFVFLEKSFTHSFHLFALNLFLFSLSARYGCLVLLFCCIPHFLSTSLHTQIHTYTYIRSYFFLCPSPTHQPQFLLRRCPRFVIACEFQIQVGFFLRFLECLGFWESGIAELFCLIIVDS